MPRSLLLVTGFFLLMLCACPDERRSTFERERQIVEKALSTAGELTRTNEVKQNGNTIESSWDFEFAGDKKAAVKSLNASKPDGYTSIRQSDSEVVFAKFDGHDSFQVTATFASPNAGNGHSIPVAVVLKGFPD